MSEKLSPLERAQNLSKVVQGGMGVNVSSWELAGTVASQGEMGTVSATGMHIVLPRTLQDGDPGGAMREALAAYPDQSAADEIMEKYFIEGGKPYDQPYKSVPMLDARALRLATNLNLAGSFAPVWLAKQRAGGRGRVAINLLTELRPPTLTSLYGAMAAGVDAVVMGAGIPSGIPDTLARLANGEPATTHLEVAGARLSYDMTFNPDDHPRLRDYNTGVTPAFLAIVSSNILAVRLSRNAVPPNGYIYENKDAGGHTAPARKGGVDATGQPVFGPIDEVNIEKLAEIGLPFWLAGGHGTPEGLADALDRGANGIQAGGIFALSRESGMTDEQRERVIKGMLDGSLHTFHSTTASATGFPFWLVIEGDDPSTENYAARTERCDLGLLGEMYAYEDRHGKEIVGHRCPAEPPEKYVKKGGDIKKTLGKVCLCNGLLATEGHGQVDSDGRHEEPVITLGPKTGEILERVVARYGTTDFSATQVVDFLRGQPNN